MSWGQPAALMEKRGLVIADGPFAETKELVLGMMVVDRESLEEAVGVADRVPWRAWARAG